MSASHTTHCVLHTWIAGVVSNCSFAWSVPAARTNRQAGSAPVHIRLRRVGLPGPSPGLVAWPEDGCCRVVVVAPCFGCF